MTRVLALTLAAVLLSAAVAEGGSCEGGTPATAVPELRFTNEGVIELWPDELAPAHPGEDFPPERDSTGWVSTIPPGASSGFELWNRMDIAGGHLVTVYAFGLQVWDVRGASARQPRLAAFADGWLGHWAHDFGYGEQDYWVLDVDAMLDPDDSDRILIWTGGRPPRVGNNLWSYRISTETLVQHYMDRFTTGEEVRLLEDGNDIWGFAVANQALQVYDARAAAGPGFCEEDNGCDHKFPIVDLPNGTRHLDVINLDGTILISITGPTSQLRLYRFEGPSTPPTLLDLDSGTSLTSRFLEHEEDLYLADVQNDRLRVRQINACRSGGCDLGSAPLRVDVPLNDGTSGLLEVSRDSRGAPWIFAGTANPFASGAQAEWLFDLSGLTPTGALLTPPEITETGDTYTSDCNGQQIGYWADTYHGNDHGWYRFGPYQGLWHPDQDVYYRLGLTALDVHVRRTPPVAEPPEASWTYSPSTLYTGTPVHFQDTSTNEPTIHSWSFFGSASPTSSSDPDPTVTWSTSGEKFVQLQACNDQGCDSLLSSVQIQDPYPQIQTASAQPDPAQPGDTVLLSASATGAPPLTWTWTTPNTTLSGNPLFYPTTGLEPGVHEIQVTVSNAHGDDVETFDLVLAEGLAIMRWEGQCPGSCVIPTGTEVAFELEVTGGEPTLYHYDWDGDRFLEETTVTPIESHVFTVDSAVFQPKLTIRNAEGQVHSFTHNLPFWVQGGTPLPWDAANLHAAWNEADERIDLAWIDRSDVETGYLVGRRKLSEPYYRILAELDPDTESWTDNIDLEPHTDYEYSVATTLGALRNAAFPATVTTPDIDLSLFRDGFESGDLSAWSSPP